MCFEIQEFIWMRARIDSFEGIYCNKNFFRDVVAREEEVRNRGLSLVTPPPSRFRARSSSDAGDRLD